MLATPIKSTRTRSTEPTAFAGLTHKPHCALCEHEIRETPPAPPPRPDPLPLPPRRPRTVETSRHFCPHSPCDYRGWLGLHHLRANGHPPGGPGRQLHGTARDGDFPEHHGTMFHGKQAAVELIEAAEPLHAFAASCRCAVHLEQRQRDEVYVVLRARKAGAISNEEAMKRLERSSLWVWTAMDPTSKWLVGVEVDPRTLARAQRVVPPVTRVVAPGGVPLFVPDGFQEYRSAILAHVGQWRPPERRQDKGPRPQPRWRPLPALHYAHVVQSYRRRRLVGVTHRVVFGTQLAIEQVLATGGWTLNTSCVARLHLDIRQRVAAIGRRVNMLCQGAAGWREQWALFQGYHNFVLPHASLRQALLIPERTHGRGAAKRWRPCTPARAAGWTEHVWSLTEVLGDRVPPWPHPPVR